MIARSDVIAGYRELLDRLPESEEVISTHQAAHGSVDAFRASLRQSPEFQSKASVSVSNLASSANLSEHTTSAPEASRSLRHRRAR
jgi:hypothetical protein